MAAGSGFGNIDAESPIVGNGFIAVNKKKRSVLKRKMISVLEVLKKAERSPVVEFEVDQAHSGSMCGTGREITLAQMQLEAKQRAKIGKVKKVSGTKPGGEKGKKSFSSKLDKHGKHMEKDTEMNEVCEMVLVLGNGEHDHKHTRIITVEDSDFYDFDQDRAENMFKKGQIWAIYDDDDGMPRHYGLIDEVVSMSPFKLNMAWLELQKNGDQGLACLEKLGFHIPCGTFKVSSMTSVNLVNVFSHLVDCERVAKQLYRIYPNKGSVWALYKDVDLESCSEDHVANYKRVYDVVVFFTNCSNVHGLSMAFLEKVESFRTVFKRVEIGCDAVRWLARDRTSILSHQIPARKLSDSEIPNGMQDCWELDPASLPPDFLTIQKGS